MSYTRFNVPEPVTDDFRGFVFEKLQAGVLKECEPDQILSVGFASGDDFLNLDTSDHVAGEYIRFSFRVDQRKVPASVLNQHMQKALQKHRDEHEGRSPSRKDRQRIRENVEMFLLRNTFPQPTGYEVIWNSSSRLLLLGATSAKVVELFLEHFEKHFRLYPLPLFHVNWALNMETLPARRKDALSSMVAVKSPTAMEEGRFLGYEFLTWLWHHTEVGGGTIGIENGKEASVYPGEKIILIVPGENKEKVTCSTQANSFPEAREALRKQKLVQEMQFFIRIGEEEYFVTLDSSLWALKSIKTPKVIPDPEAEAADRFLEQVYFLERIQTVLDALYKKYLTLRLSPEWEARVLPELKAWINEGEVEDEEEAA